MVFSLCRLYHVGQSCSQSKAKILRDYYSRCLINDQKPAEFTRTVSAALCVLSVHISYHQGQIPLPEVLHFQQFDKKKKICLHRFVARISGKKIKSVRFDLNSLVVLCHIV